MTDKKKVRNLIVELKEKQTIFCNGPVTITLIEACRNNNKSKSLISLKATADVIIKKDFLGE